MKLNRNFAKLKQDGTLDYGPIPLKVVTHHHEEEDVPKYDPETGEPTGETEHVVRDWDTTENKAFPTAADFRQMGYLPVDYAWTPSDPAPEGKEWTRTGKFVDADGTLVPEYAATDIPPPPPKVYSTSDLIYALMSRGVYATCRQWIEEKGYRDLVLATKEFTDDLESFETIKQGLQQLLGYTDEQVAEVLAEAEVV